MARFTKQEQEEAKEHLRNWLKPGDTVYTVLRHVSRSGMMRHIDVYAIKADENGETNKLYLSYNVARALEYSTTEGGALKVGGCGMDMGYHIAHSLSMALYPEYQCTGEDNKRRKCCGSGDHVNGPKPAKRDGKMVHHDGYALEHEWI